LYFSIVKEQVKRGMKKAFIATVVLMVCAGSWAGIAVVGGAPQVGSVSTTGGSKTNVFTAVSGDVLVIGMGSNKTYDPTTYGIANVIGGSGTAVAGTSYASTTGSEKNATYINTFTVTADGTIEIQLPQLANQSTVYAAYLLRADSGSIGVAGSASGTTSTAPATGLSLDYTWSESFTGGLLIETVSAHKDTINDMGGWDKGSGSSSSSLRMVDSQFMDDTYTNSAFSFTDVAGGDSATGLGVAFVEQSATPQPPGFGSDPVVGADALQDVAYAGSLLDHASDPNGDSIMFWTTNAPGWLTVAANGALSGTPLVGDLGTNTWTVFATDGISGTNSAALQITVLSGPPTPQITQTNIVLIVIDDLGWMDLSIQGSEFYETPRIDQLATNGMRFTQGYAAHPRCLPSRYGLMTGRFPGANGVPGGPENNLRPSEVTVAEALKAGGYATCFAGKWHLVGTHGTANLPQNQGFEVNFSGGKAGAPPTYFYPYRKEGTPAPTDELDKNALYFEDEGSPGEYVTDRLTDEAINWMTWNADRPMFLSLWHYGVHTPFEAPAGLVAKYTSKLATMDYGSLPEEINVGVGQQKMRQDHPTYAAMIESVDTNIGRLMDKVAELGITNNTVFIFTSDNGGLSNRGGHNSRTLATSNYPLRTGKGWLYEGGIREAFIVSGAGVSPMVNSNAVVTGTDIFPTCLELAGLPLQTNDHHDGVSFVSALDGSAYDRGEPIFWHSPQARPYSTGDFNSSAVREGNYKLIWFFDTPGQPYELYNVKTDPGENNDLAESMPAKAVELLGKVQAWHTGAHDGSGVIFKPDADDVSKPPQAWLDEASAPLALVPGGGSIHLSWGDYLGYDYNLFSKTNLTDVVWISEGSGIVTNENTLPMVGNQAFYKVELVLQPET